MFNLWKTRLKLQQTESFNLKQRTLQNPLDLIVDYEPTCAKAPVIFPHKI
jgi:hypothetical protein